MTLASTTYFLLAGVLAGSLAIVAGLAFVILRRQRLGCSQTKLQMPVMGSSQTSTSAPTSHVPALLESPEGDWPQPPAPGNGLSGEWVEFATQRLDELAPRNNTDETKWALGVIDFLDELKVSDAESSPAERNMSASLSKTLVAFLSAKGFSPVDSDEWAPDMQRAVAVVRNPDAIGTTILGKGATGLSRDGKIIRKQEVKIEMKGS